MIGDARHIKAFLAVARLGNFTRAAAELHVSQPALTVQIKQFEATLGVVLFDRNKRQVSLTQVGRDLLGPLERLYIDMQTVISSAHDLGAHRRGIVTVAALPSVAASLLPLTLHRFSERYPGIAVRIRDVVAGRIVELVKSGQADFGIGTWLKSDRDVAVRDLLKDRMCVFVPRGHPLSARHHINLRELVPYPLILTNQETSVRQLVDRAFHDAGLAVTVAQEAGYMSTVIGLVNAGLGIAVLPESAAYTISAPRLRRIPIRSPALTRNISVIEKVGRSLSPAAEKFVEALREAVKEHRLHVS